MLARQAGVLGKNAAQLPVTTNSSKGDKPGGVRIDHIFVEGFEVSGYEICQKKYKTENGTEHYPSDHFPVIVTLNAFVTDNKEEIDFVRNFCEERNCDFALSEVWEKGGEGGIELANAVLNTLENKESNFHVLYDEKLPIQVKISAIAKEIYGADGVNYAGNAAKQIERLESLGFGNLPICMAKTQYSLSDDQTLLGKPSDFSITVREVYVSAGAGFIVVLTGSVMTMPGLPKKPAAYSIDVDNAGKITGLF